MGHSVFQRLLKYAKANYHTFTRRSTPLPDGIPFAFTNDFRKDARKQVQWRAFIRKSKPDLAIGDLDLVVGEVAEFLMPILKAFQENNLFNLFWAKNRGWCDYGKNEGTREG